MLLLVGVARALVWTSASRMTRSSFCRSVLRTAKLATYAARRGPAHRRLLSDRRRRRCAGRRRSARRRLEARIRAILPALGPFPGSQRHCAVRYQLPSGSWRAVSQSRRRPRPLCRHPLCAWECHASRLHATAGGFPETPAETRHPPASQSVAKRSARWKSLAVHRFWLAHERPLQPVGQPSWIDLVIA